MRTEDYYEEYWESINKYDADWNYQLASQKQINIMNKTQEQIDEAIAVVKCASSSWIKNEIAKGKDMYLVKQPNNNYRLNFGDFEQSLIKKLNYAYDDIIIIKNEEEFNNKLGLINKLKTLI